MKMNLDLATNGPGLLNFTQPTEQISKDYPQFTIHGNEEVEIPEEGTMTVKYRLTRKSEEDTERGESYSCTVQVQEIVSCECCCGKDCKGECENGGEKEDEAEAPAGKSKNGAGEALDALLEAAKKLKQGK